MTSGLNKIIEIENGRKINAQRVHSHYLQQLFWECTLRCNLRCKHCGSSCSESDSRWDMPLSDFLPVLDEIKQHYDKPVLVITTGGEPLLRKDIFECGREITGRGFYWGIVTNGTFLDEEKLSGLLEAGLNSISISIDGLCETHNWMRGNEHSFAHALHAVDIIANTPSELTWDVITCVNQMNVSQLVEMRDLLIAHGVKRWKIFTVFPMGRAREHAEMLLTKEQYKSLLDFIVSERKNKAIKVSYGCEGFLGPYEYEVRDDIYFCAAGVNVASIRYDGSISGCLSIRYDYNQGSIYKDSFWEVWNNRFLQYREFSWKQNGVCRDCEVWRWCKGNGMHLRDDKGNLAFCNYRHLFIDQ